MNVAAHSGKHYSSQSTEFHTKNSQGMQVIDDLSNDDDDDGDRKPNVVQINDIESDEYTEEIIPVQIEKEVVLADVDVQYYDDDKDFCTSVPNKKNDLIVMQIENAFQMQIICEEEPAGIDISSDVANNESNQISLSKPYFTKYKKADSPLTID